MDKDKALDLALEALELTWDSGMPHPNIMQVGKAITAIKQALAAPVQERCEYCDGTGDVHDQTGEWRGTCHCVKAAQPAPVQEPVAQAWAEGYRAGIDDERTSEANIGIAGMGMKVEPARNNPYHTTPPAQPAVPDAIGPNEDELPAYAAGWNDCRQAMLEIMK